MCYNFAKLVGMLFVLFNNVQYKTQGGFFPYARQLGKGINSLFDYFRAKFQFGKDN